jgi:hypothetical protein
MVVMAAMVVVAMVVMAATVVMLLTQVTAVTVVMAATADIITAIGSLGGRVGFTAIGISGAASGIAGIQMATTDPVGMSAAPTCNQRKKVASGPLPLADL